MFPPPRSSDYWTPAVRIITLVCLAVFAVQRIMAAVDPALAGMFTLAFGLSRHYLAQGFVWQFASYAFLHGGVLHLGLNLLVVVLLGSALETTLGSARFWFLFLLSATIGGLGWMLFATDPRAICIGASGGVFGLIGAYAGMFPRRQITLWLFFLVPLSLQAWVLALVLALSTLVNMTLGTHAQTAYVAHLAGGLAGLLYGRMRVRRFAVRRGQWPWTLDRKRFWNRLVRRGRRSRSPADAVDLDALLDKISRRGLASLSSEEQAALHRHARRGLEGGAGRRDAP